MQTLQVQLNDELYNSLSTLNIDIQSKISEYLSNLVYDGYPAISSTEAKQRVSNAVDRYKDGTTKYIPLDDNYVKSMNDYTESL